MDDSELIKFHGHKVVKEENCIRVIEKGGSVRIVKDEKLSGERCAVTKKGSGEIRMSPAMYKLFDDNPNTLTQLHVKIMQAKTSRSKEQS